MFVGLHLKLGKFKGRCLIYGGSVSALKTAELNGHGIVLGAGLTIQEMGAKLKDMESKIPGNITKTCPCIIQRFLKL